MFKTRILSLPFKIPEWLWIIASCFRTASQRVLGYRGTLFPKPSLIPFIRTFPFREHFYPYGIRSKWLSRVSPWEGPSQASDLASLAQVSLYCGDGHHRLSAPAAIQHLDPSNQQPRLRFLPAAQGECPALATISHSADLVLIAINKLGFWFYFQNK